VVPSQTLTKNMRHNAIESVAIVNSAFLAPPIVKTESLFIEVSEQVERFDAHIGCMTNHADF